MTQQQDSGPSGDTDQTLLAELRAIEWEMVEIIRRMEVVRGKIHALQQGSESNEERLPGTL